MDMTTYAQVVYNTTTTGAVTVGIVTWLGTTLPAWVTILTFLWFIMLIGEKLYNWYKASKKKEE